MQETSPGGSVIWSSDFESVFNRNKRIIMPVPHKPLPTSAIAGCRSGVRNNSQIPGLSNKFSSILIRDWLAVQLSFNWFNFISLIMMLSSTHPNPRLSNLYHHLFCRMTSIVGLGRPSTPALLYSFMALQGMEKPPSARLLENLSQVQIQSGSHIQLLPEDISFRFMIDWCTTRYH